jgi:hypothetical protein
MCLPFSLWQGSSGHLDISITQHLISWVGFKLAMDCEGYHFIGPDLCLKFSTARITPKNTAVAKLSGPKRRPVLTEIPEKMAVKR